MKIELLSYRISLLRMDKEDARFQTLGQLHERRKQIVRLHRKKIGVMRIAELSGLSYPAVRGVIDRLNGMERQRSSPRYAAGNVATAAT
ncbi:MAG: Winged helix-turn helix [Candidatus Nitrotoga sp. MKT]|nr:MAG: Winged helix-turn helix [Candidatus Nitrotoga sp. MKT]